MVKENGLAPVFLGSRLDHTAGWICARYKYSVLLLLLFINIVPSYSGSVYRGERKYIKTWHQNCMVINYVNQKSRPLY